MNKKYIMLGVYFAFFFFQSDLLGEGFETEFEGAKKAAAYLFLNCEQSDFLELENKIKSSMIGESLDFVFEKMGSRINGIQPVYISLYPKENTLTIEFTERLSHGIASYSVFLVLEKNKIQRINFTHYFSHMSE